MQCMKIDMFLYIEQNTFFQYTILDYFLWGGGEFWVIGWEYDLLPRTASFFV